MARSDSILGRKANQRMFEACLKGKKSFAVMTYGYGDKYRYADATWMGLRNKRHLANAPRIRPMHDHPKVARIRIIVTPKPIKGE